jgi:predicted ATPase
MHEAEAHRLLGELRLRQPTTDVSGAETSFVDAIEVARSQSAKGFELRATASLARLWQHQGKRRQAFDLLTPVYNWFTEGFDTRDLQQAKALLEELS